MWRVRCEGCNVGQEYRGEGFLCETCAREDERLIRDQLAREIVDGCREKYMHADLLDVANWIEREFLS